MIKASHVVVRGKEAENTTDEPEVSEAKQKITPPKTVVSISCASFGSLFIIIALLATLSIAWTIVYAYGKSWHISDQRASYFTQVFQTITKHLEIPTSIGKATAAAVSSELVISEVNWQNVVYYTCSLVDAAREVFDWQDFLLELVIDPDNYRLVGTRYFPYKSSGLSQTMVHFNDVHLNQSLLIYGSNNPRTYELFDIEEYTFYPFYKAQVPVARSKLKPYWTTGLSPNARICFQEGGCSISVVYVVPILNRTDSSHMIGLSTLGTLIQTSERKYDNLRTYGFFAAVLNNLTYDHAGVTDGVAYIVDKETGYFLSSSVKGISGINVSQELQSVFMTKVEDIDNIVIRESALRLLHEHGELYENLTDTTSHQLIMMIGYSYFNVDYQVYENMNLRWIIVSCIPLWGHVRPILNFVVISGVVTVVIVAGVILISTCAMFVVNRQVRTISRQLKDSRFVSKLENLKLNKYSIFREFANIQYSFYLLVGELIYLRSWLPYHLKSTNNDDEVESEKVEQNSDSHSTGSFGSLNSDDSSDDTETTEKSSKISLYRAGCLVVINVSRIWEGGDDANESRFELLFDVIESKTSSFFTDDFPDSDCVRRFRGDIMSFDEKQVIVGFNTMPRENLLATFVTKALEFCDLIKTRLTEKNLCKIQVGVCGSKDKLMVSDLGNMNNVARVVRGNVKDVAVLLSQMDILSEGNDCVVSVFIDNESHKLVPMEFASIVRPHSIVFAPKLKMEEKNIIVLEFQRVFPEARDQEWMYVLDRNRKIEVERMEYTIFKELIYANIDVEDLQTKIDELSQDSFLRKILEEMEGLGLDVKHGKILEEYLKKKMEGMKVDGGTRGCWVVSQYM